MSLSAAIRELRDRLDEIGAAGRAIAREEALRAALETQRRTIARYPEGRTGTGTRTRGRGASKRRVSKTQALRAGVIVQPLEGDGFAVVTTAKHAHLVERGTRERQTRAGASRGAMPALGPVLIQEAVRARREMVRRAEQRLQAVVDGGAA